MSLWEKIIAGLFAILFVLVPLIWLPWTSELFEFNKLMATYVIAALIAGAWAIRMLVEKRLIFKHTTLDIPLLLFLGFSILSLVFSIDVHTSWYGYYSRWNGGLLSLLTYAFLYWAFVSNMTKKSVLLTINSSLFTSIIIAIYGAFEHWGHSASCYFVTGHFDVACWVQDVQNRVYATLGQPNWMGAYLVSLIFIPLANLLKSQISNLKSQINSKDSNFKVFDLKNYLDLRILNLVLFILLFAALLFTKSRSGMLAFAISSVVFWGLTSPTSPKRILLKGVSLWILVVGILTLSISNPIRDILLRTTNHELSTTQGTALESGGTESGSIRKIVWTGAYRMWTSSIKNFLIGTGPETFAQSYYQYRPTEHNQTSEWELLYNKAHNEFLNQLATTGILGFAAYIILLIFMFRILLNTKYLILDTALLAGWLSISVTNFWGFSVVVTQLFLFLLPAMAISLEQESRRAGEYKMGTGQILGVLVACSSTLLLLYSVWQYWQADSAYASGSNAFRGFQASQDPQYLLTSYRGYYQAFSNNPSEPAILSDFSLSAAYLALASRNNSTDSAQLANQSLALSQVAIAASPHHPNYFKNRARSLILLSELDARYLTLAKQTMQAAQIISPTDPRIPYYLGVILKSQGATPEAKLYFQQALDLKPDFLDAQGQLTK